MREKLVDRAVARIAARQHGAITVEQLRSSGLERSAVARRLAAGRLHRVHRGVYAVGHPGLDDRGRWKAATLACGHLSALSHRSAAELWGLIGSRDGPIHVSVRSPSGRARRDGLILHRRAALEARALTARDGIPWKPTAGAITVGAWPSRRTAREATS